MAYVLNSVISVLCPNLQNNECAHKTFVLHHELINGD